MEFIFSFLLFSIQIAIAASRLAEVLDDMTKRYTSHWIDYKTDAWLGIIFYKRLLWLLL